MKGEIKIKFVEVKYVLFLLKKNSRLVFLNLYLHFGVKQKRMNRLRIKDDARALWCTTVTLSRNLTIW
jgi:hypothetical protein